MDACPGCGLLLAPHDGPTHPYIGASSACWALFGGVLAREYEDAAELGAAHRLTVDTYAIQHPGEPGRRSTRSVCLHLVSLQLALEAHVPPDRLTRVLAIAGARLHDLRWLDPPERRGERTVADLATAQSATEHVELAWVWARDVWDAWHEHHPTVRDWAARIMPSG